MRRVYALLLCLCFPVAACAHASAEDRHLVGMGDEISRVQAEHEELEKRAAGGGENISDGHTAPVGRPTAATQTPARGSRVDGHGNGNGNEAARANDPQTGTGNDDPEDTAPRPVIRVQGNGSKGKARGSEGAPATVIQESAPEDSSGAATGPAITQDAPKPSALDPEARRAYDAALALVNAKRYDAALDAFATFLVRWPDHPFADNATYWRGECYFAKGEFARASEQFEGVIARFPLGNKLPDALLKLGMACQKLGNPAKAKDAFDKLERGYPKSDAARRIPRTENP